MSRFVRITVTLPKDLLAAADARAKRLDRSRSWVVAEALRRLPSETVVRESALHPYESGLGAYRQTQLEADLALTPEARVLEAERTAREAELSRGVTPGDGLRFFDRFEDYLTWKRREDT